MFEKLGDVERHYEEISEKLQDPAVIGDQGPVSYTHLGTPALIFFTIKSWYMSFIIIITQKSMSALENMIM